MAPLSLFCQRQVRLCQPLGHHHHSSCKISQQMDSMELSVPDCTSIHDQSTTSYYLLIELHNVLEQIHRDARRNPLESFQRSAAPITEEDLASCERCLSTLNRLRHTGNALLRMMDEELRNECDRVAVMRKLCACKDCINLRKNIAKTKQSLEKTEAYHFSLASILRMMKTQM